MKRQNIVKIWLAVSGIKSSDMAIRIGITKQGLDYHLKKDGDIDQDLYDRIKKEIPKNVVTEIEHPFLELEHEKKTNKILMEKIDKLEDDNERLRVQSEKDIVVDVSKDLGKKRK